MSSLSVFHFDALEVRAVTIDGNPWFVASDVCAALGHSNPSKAVSDHVDDDDKSNHSLGLPGKRPLVVNESGLYALIFGSQLESAKRFKKWVTSEVLPSIRTTGGYIAPQVSSAPGIEQDLRVVGILADLLRVAPSGRITMAQVVLQQSAPHLLPVLPAYAIDSSIKTQPGEWSSSDPTASLTDLLKRHGITMSAAKVNLLLEREEWAEKQIADALAQDDFKQEVADSALLGNIESPFNACMHQEHCKAWKEKASAGTPATADLTDDQIIDLFHRKTTGLGRKGIIAFARAMFAAAPQPQSDPAPYLYFDPHNGDTWTQEAINYECCPPDGLIALYTHSQRKPLTDEAVLGVAKSIEIQFDSERLNEQIDDILAFARAIERTHGIGGNL